MNKLIGIGLLCSLATYASASNQIKSEWEKSINRLHVYLQALLEDQEYEHINSILFGVQAVEEIIKDEHRYIALPNDSTPVELRYNQTIFYYGRDSIQ